MVIPAVIVDAMVAHCQAEAPIEACGILAGRGDQVTQHVPMGNAEQSECRFALDVAEQLAVYAGLDDADLDPLAVYHSHTSGQPYPSPTDVRLAVPGVRQVIVGTAGEPTVRAYRIDAGTVLEEPLRIA